PCFALSYHSKYVIRNNVQVLDIGISNVLHFVVIHQVTEQILKMIRKVKFKILQRAKRLSVLVKRGIDVQLYVRTKKRRKTFQDSAPCVFINFFVEYFLKRVDSENDTN